VSPFGRTYLIIRSQSPKKKNNEKHTQPQFTIVLLGEKSHPKCLKPLEALFGPCEGHPISFWLPGLFFPQVSSSETVGSISKTLEQRSAAVHVRNPNRVSPRPFSLQ